jgi:hypothetical protein
LLDDIASNLPLGTVKAQHTEMKKLSLIVCIVLLTAKGFSQSDFRSGFIITNTRDTLVGLVNYREGSKAFSACEFKGSEKGDEVTHLPGQIVGYGFAGDKFFQSREIVVREQEKTMVFVEVLVRGLVSLYKYENSYFLEKRGEALHTLMNQTAEEIVNGTTVRKKTNSHMSVLNMLMFDCVAMRSRLQKAISLTEKPVTSLVEDYNRCMGAPSVSFKAKKSWLKLGVGFAGGLEFSKIKFDSDYEPIKHLRGDFDLSKLPLIGISLECKAPRLSERIAFLAELYYTNATYHLFKVSTVQPYTYRDDVTIEIDELKIPMGIRYIFPQKKIAPFAGLGITNIIHLNSSTNWRYEAEAGTYFESFDEKALDVKKNQFGIWGGVGANISISHKLNAFIELRYEQTDGIASSSLLSLSTVQSDIKNVDVLVGIRLK